ncbi:kinesin-like protein KIN-14L isoform X2 [Camellia sinensis]|uniref:kinesin-like protein KIN-14L isoform X2 n=1 Tax=Camellia sinensis TaxID=4442 RepID=UPI0010358776|nr:kinesin-like protein KIN-14L isoform X2 [Camellia sinensis]
MGGKFFNSIMCLDKLLLKCGSTRDQGINYLALSDLFRLSNTRKNIMKYDIHVQMVEIYNEQVRDLLAEDSKNTKLEIRSCTSENGLSIPDASMHYVESTNDVLSLMKRGDLNRVVSSTAINNQSSRSHSVLTVHVHGKDVSGSILRSCLHLVDLAGSERVEKSEVNGDGLKEAQYINKSLSCLGDVISALAQKSSHIPYRNSKLTLLLQNALGGHAKTLMFAHVSPEADSFGETISTLKFAQRVLTVELGVSHMNKESSEVMELKQQIESLKKALANKEAQTVRPTKSKEPRSPLEKPPHARTERTPPRSQRLSIENSNKTEMKRAINSVDKRGPKDPVQIKLSETVSNLLPSEAVLVQKYTQFQDPVAATKPYGHVSNGESMIDIYRPRAPLSPTLQPKTPEPPKLVRNEVHIMMHGESNFSTEPRTPGLTSNANGKGSHIRKSLRTIGKLIKGSEKRNQQKMVEASPVNGMRKIHDARSPVSSNASPLTGVVQTSDRRSSLGGKSTDSCKLN